METETVVACEPGTVGATRKEIVKLEEQEKVAQAALDTIKASISHKEEMIRLNIARTNDKLATLTPIGHEVMSEWIHKETEETEVGDMGRMFDKLDGVKAFDEVTEIK